MNYLSKLKYSKLFSKFLPSLKIERKIKPSIKYDTVKIQLDSIEEKQSETGKEIQKTHITKWTDDYTYPEDRTISKFKLKDEEITQWRRLPDQTDLPFYYRFFWVLFAFITFNLITMNLNLVLKSINNQYLFNMWYPLK